MHNTGDAGQALTKHTLIIKTLDRLGMGVDTPEHSKGCECKPVVNFMLKEENFKEFPLNSGTKEKYALSLFLSNIVLKIYQG